MFVAISSLLNVVFGPLLAPIPNFIQIGWKTLKLKIYAVGQFWLVGPVAQKMVVAITNLFKVVLFRYQPPYQISSRSDKNIEVENFRYLVVLVGRAGRSKNGRSHFKRFLCCFWDIISSHTTFHPNWTNI